MPSAQQVDTAFPFSYASYPLPDLSRLSDTVTRQAALTSPDECLGFDFFDGIGDESNLTQPSSSSSSSPTSSFQYAALQAGPAEEQPKVARPPNAWILYRSTKLAEYKQQNPHMYTGVKRTKSDRGSRPTQANMSKQIAELWAQEPAAVKDHFHQEAMLKSVIHAAEHPGYRFNPNKGRRNRNAKSRSPAKSSAELSTVTSPSQGPTGSTAIPASAPALSSRFGMAIPSPQRMPSWETYSSVSPVPSSSQSFTSYNMDRNASLNTQLEAIFPKEATASLVYSSSSASSAVSSPPWTGGLMPALSIGDSRGYATGSCTSPNTPFSEVDIFGSSLSDYATSAPNDSFTQYAIHSPYFTTSSNTSYTFPAVQSAPAQQTISQHLQAMQPPSQTFKIEEPTATSTSVNSNGQYPDWWPYRHLKVRLDEANGIPLEDLLRSLQTQK